MGFANLAGDETFPAYLWRKGVMTDLGTLPGDVHSVGQAIDCQRQVGRTSDADFNGVGYLWENGAMSDGLEYPHPGGFAAVYHRRKWYQ